jgi:hypothetical protein
MKSYKWVDLSEVKIRTAKEPNKEGVLSEVKTRTAEEPNAVGLPQ